jgi:5'-nucleotidase
MRILVTNDDGIASPGIWALAEAMNRVGDVLIVAPDKQQSGVGTAVSFHNGIDVAEMSSSIDGLHAYAVNGTPTDCVILGLSQLAEGNVDLIVSGINTGANVGNGVLGSGTVMPIRVARRIPSFAMSLSRHGPQDNKELHFHLAGSVAELLARKIAEGEMPPSITLNVNVPSVPAGEIRGLTITRLASISYWRLKTKQGSDGLHYHGLSPIEEDNPNIEEGTDIWALNKGLVSITPLRFEITNDEIVPTLRKHTHRLDSALKQMMEAL